MTIAETTELKMNSTGISNTVDGILNPLNNRDPQQLEQISNSSMEANPLLESNRVDHSSVKIDTSTMKSKKMDKEEDDWASMNTSRRDPEVNDCNAIVPPDGGLRAWMIMIGSFVINGVLFSVINTYSLIYLELQKRLLDSGETAASSKAGKCFIFFRVLCYYKERITKKEYL